MKKKYDEPEQKHDTVEDYNHAVDSDALASRTFGMYQGILEKYNMLLDKYNAQTDKYQALLEKLEKQANINRNVG